jgi:hypothetical protein
MCSPLQQVSGLTPRLAHARTSVSAEDAAHPAILLSKEVLLPPSPLTCLPLTPLQTPTHTAPRSQEKSATLSRRPLRMAWRWRLMPWPCR